MTKGIYKLLGDIPRGFEREKDRDRVRGRKIGKDRERKNVGRGEESSIEKNIRLRNI